MNKTGTCVWGMNQMLELKDKQENAQNFNTYILAKADAGKIKVRKEMNLLNM